MASINKLSIRGVRAFSPEDQEQVIEFYFPVTVIVGANGCGKTTIIESLKYAVTGSLPPGNKSGQAFVHDPKSIGSASVKANVKLRFTNRAGTQMVVVRSMEVTQKKTTMTFKALDGILRTTDANTGERLSMSHKCTELDRQIPMLLGVSKPILEHVVFCHQEDSSWPLLEGAVLKKRFDDIFDSTRYAKALKAIQETKKEYTGIVKDLKVELSGLSSHKHAAKGFRQELTSHGEQLEELEEDLKACREEIRQAEEESKRNEQIAEQVEELNCDLEDKRTQLDKELSAEGIQRSMLSEDLTQKTSARELKDMLRDFDNQVTRQLERKKDLEREVRALQNSMEEIQQNDKSQRERIGKLYAEKVAHDKMLRKRFAKMEKIADKYNIDLPVSQTQNTQTQNASFISTQNSISESVGDTTVLSQDTMLSISVEDMYQFLKALEDKEADLQQSLRNYTDQSQKQVDAIQDELNEMTALSKATEHELKKLEKEQSDGRAEISNLNSQVPTHSRMRKNDIEETKRQAVHYAKERDKANSDTSLAEIPAQIRNCEGQIDVLKREIENDNNDLRELRKNTDAQNSITVLKEQAVLELENLQDSLKEYGYTFMKFELPAPGALPGVDGDDDGGDELVEAIENISTSVLEKYETVQQELSKARGDEVTKQRFVSEKSALLAHNKQNLASLRSKVDALGGSVSKFQKTVNAIRQFEQAPGLARAFQGTDPQAVMAHLTTRIDDIEKSSNDSIQPEVLAKILDQIYSMATVQSGGEKKVHCPCCTREFDGVDEVRTFRDSLERMKDVETSELLRANMHQVEKSRETKAEYQRWRTAVSETMHDVLDWNRMTTEAKDTQVAIDGIESELAARQTELSKLQGDTSDLQTNADELRDAVDASRRWTEDAARLSRKKMEIGQKKVDLSISTSTVAIRDLQTVEDDLAKRQAEKESLNNKIMDLNKQMTKLNETIANFSKKATQFEKLARDKQAKYEEEQLAQFRKTELQQRLAVIGDEIPKLKSQVQQSKQKIRSKEGDRNRFRQSVQDEERSQREHLHKFQSDVSSLRQMTAEIDSYVSSNNEEELDRIQQKLLTLDESMKQKKAESALILPKLNAINKEVEDQVSHKKMIEGNLKVIEIRGKIEVLKKDIAQMEKDRNAVEGYDTYVQNAENVQARLSKLHESRAHHEGRRGGIIDQMRSLKRKLKTPEYKDIDERHRIVVIKHETTQMAVSDLDKYHAALDNALLRYHGSKITEINRIIRELWNLTYKGEDISNIELVSGEEKNARKSYNYRVVMSKGGTKLDMRGRCSAGQRVLASIVIRLALAETFCVNFGCIALDEPTVNLDYNNKRGLAIALAQIIASRSQQRNFQLLVITHDEEFVTMMKAELASQSGFSMPEKYFVVRREEAADGKHYSKIDAIDWDELV